MLKLRQIGGDSEKYCKVIKLGKQSLANVLQNGVFKNFTKFPRKQLF